MGVCKVDRCNRKDISKGYCSKHYQRFRKYGDPLYTKVELHGKKHEYIYNVWRGIKARCDNKKATGYANYGGRGILVCDRWKNSFSLFYRDMGERPSFYHQIDRIDNDGNYEPDNCRWVTAAENGQNRRTNILNWYMVRSIRRIYNLKRFSYKQLAKIYNIKVTNLKHVVCNESWQEPDIKGFRERNHKRGRRG